MSVENKVYTTTASPVHRFNVLCVMCVERMRGSMYNDTRVVGESYDIAHQEGWNFNNL